MKYTKRIIAFCVVMALVLGVVELPENTVYAAKNAAYITPAKLQMSLGKTVPITVYKAKKKIVFSIISGSNRISIKQTKKNKCVVKSLKTGRAVLQAKVGNKKLKCTITIKKEPKKKTATTEAVYDKNEIEVTTVQQRETEENVTTQQTTALPVTTTQSITTTQITTTTQAAATTEDPNCSLSIKDEIMTITIRGQIWPALKNNDIVQKLNTSKDAGVTVKKIVLKGTASGDLSFLLHASKDSPLQSVTQIDASDLDTSKVTNMKNFFTGCSGCQMIRLNGWNTQYVTDMSGMFSGCSSLLVLDVSDFNTSRVVNMNDMFWNCESLPSLTLDNFDTARVCDMSGMFWKCEGLDELDVSAFDTSRVINMSQMFYGCSGLKAIDISHFNTENVTNMEDMFWACSNLKNINLQGVSTDSVTTVERMFQSCSALEELDLSGFDLSNAVELKGMLTFCSSLSKIKTPQVMSSLNVLVLPSEYEDAEGNGYKEIPVGEKNSITLTKKEKM